MNRYDYEYEWDGKYCYPNSFVLKNKLNIQDAKALEEAERRITALNILEIKENPIYGRFDLKHLQSIHMAIFHDIYSWAGELRTVDIAKGNQFCLWRNIESYANEIFSRLTVKDFLTAVNIGNIPERLTYYLSDINVLHPFREGNGRAQRVFIEYLAGIAGFHADFSMVSDKEMIEASAFSFGLDYGMMRDMFKRIITPVSHEDHKAFCEKMGFNA